MNKIFRIFAAAALIAGVSAACTDLSDFEDRIDSLEGRVTALETQILGLNANIEALQQLVAGGTINSATNNNGVWTLVLTNGETLTLTQGSIGVGNPPVMSVDKDGYWMVDYGTGATHILIDGNKVKAYVFFRGRSILFKDQGELLLARFANDLEEYGKVEAMPKLEGKRMIVNIAPKK